MINNEQAANAGAFPTRCDICVPFVWYPAGAEGMVIPSKTDDDGLWLSPSDLF